MITKKQQIDRLLEDWKKYGRIVIGVDVDDTIMPYNMATKQDCEEVMSILREAQATGAYLAINTACGQDREKEILEYCKNNRLEIHGYNKTVIDVTWGRPGSKIYANLYIDDRGGITECIEVLIEALYAYRGYLQNEKPLTEIG